MARGWTPNHRMLLFLPLSVLVFLQECVAGPLRFGTMQQSARAGHLRNRQTSLISRQISFVAPVAVRKSSLSDDSSSFGGSKINAPVHPNPQMARKPISVFGMAVGTTENRTSQSGGATFKARPAQAQQNVNSTNSSVSNRDANGTMSQTNLYPPLPRNCNGTLQVDSIHTLYYEEYGRDPANESEADALHPPLTALFLHGGPGAGCFPNHARFFDPARYRIILFDQRGCGRSAPRGETRNNSLAHLVEDCEALRAELGVEKWDVVLGGSWGATLALAYAQEYPGSVSSIILRGVCTFRSQEVEWLFGRDGGASVLNPAGWKEFEDAVGIDASGCKGGDTRYSEDNHNDLEKRRAALHAYYDCLLGEDSLVRLQAAKSWFKWEMGISALAGFSGNDKDKDNSDSPIACLQFRKRTGWEFLDKGGQHVALNSAGQAAPDVVSSLRQWQRSSIKSPSSRNGAKIRSIQQYELPANLTPLNCAEDEAKQFIPAQAMLTCFYSVNDKYMMQKFDLLSKERIERIRHIPCIAVQGGQDTICPIDTALDLHTVWPEMELRVLLASGHSMYDPAISRELVRATERLQQEGTN
eukprot:CAMPEP_0113573726 /NCGR_PEP_ID=MMETSP0015_2-20120614/26774_1 /TAXON_ID=2838 /ORGANISM="Odontella" /LENGTH=584 /DNA_ID=CAMNT_0000476829 /DNA_START=218 /DNA_END=1972 /DNA_ORIENTATION=+ /assembly_acc=CAM_ASM_000160